MSAPSQELEGEESNTNLSTNNDEHEPITHHASSHRQSIVPTDDSMYETISADFKQTDLEQIVDGCVGRGMTQEAGERLAYKLQAHSLFERSNAQSELLAKMRDQLDIEHQEVATARRKAEKWMIKYAEMSSRLDNITSTTSQTATGHLGSLPPGTRSPTTIPLPPITSTTGHRGETPGSSTSNSTPRVKISNPKPLTDGKKPRVDDWAYDVRHKLRRCTEEYVTEQDRIDYVVGMVEAPARDHIRTQLEPDAPRPFGTAEEVIRTLERAYGKSRAVRQQEASDEYQRLYQKDRSFSEFWSDFVRLTTYLEMTPSQQLRDLQTRITLDLKKALFATHFTDPHEMADACTLLEPRIRSAKREEERVNRAKTKKEGAYRAPNKTTFIEHKAKLIEPTAKFNEPRAVREMTNCYGCGKEGHLRRDCPTNPPKVNLVEEASHDSANRRLSQSSVSSCESEYEQGKESL